MHQLSLISNQKIVVLFNHKGGTGKTSIATHLCFLAAERGIRTMALSLDDQADIIRWGTRGQSIVPGRLYECTDTLSALYSPGRLPAGIDEDLVVVDMSAWSGNAKLTGRTCGWSRCSIASPSRTR